MTIELYAFNIAEAFKLDLVYPVSLNINIFSEFDMLTKECPLLQVFKINCTPIEVEGSINIIMDLINTNSKIMEFKL